MPPLQNTTLVFLIKKPAGVITEVCLGLKKQGLGIGRWNGIGGKVEPGETIEVAAKREVQEEINVQIHELTKVAELTCIFSHSPAWNQLVHVYLVENWIGEPQESDEMKPQWFSATKLPFHAMWPDDPFWLPQVLQGKHLEASFTFEEHDVIKHQHVNVIV
jgi:mutator protein MutT